MSRGSSDWRGDVSLAELRTTARRPNYKYTELRTGTWLAERIAAGRSVDEMAAELGCPAVTITTAMKRHRVGEYAVQVDCTTTARQRIRERLEKRDE